MARCDLHVHTVFSTDSGNFALRRARLGESFTEPERVYDTCRRRGMSLVTISDHNTLDGALRIADRPGTFLSVEVTTRFEEDDIPLHVLVWNLTEEDHRDLQPYRASVVELAAFLRDRNLAHALAHPLYRMGKPITVAHVEKMMLLFRAWEGRNGARPESSNLLACRLAQAATPEYLQKLAERHGFGPFNDGHIALTGGSDDHGSLDIATTWTEAPGTSVDEFLASIMRGECVPHGEHGSTVKLAHAVGALAINAYRASGKELPPFVAGGIAGLFDSPTDGPERHDRIVDASTGLARLLGGSARAGGVSLDSFSTIGNRLASLVFAGALEAPYVASLRHHSGTRSDITSIEAGFFGVPRLRREPRALVFTDTFSETNGVAGTMRRLAAAGAAREIDLAIVTAGRGEAPPGVIHVEPDWTVRLPAYESLELAFPTLTRVLARVEREKPDVIHVATPGPIGLCGMAAAKLLGIPLVGSYHTELGPYALHLTRDALVADTFAFYVDWFYRQCNLVLAPTATVRSALDARGFRGKVGLWGRGVDAELFHPRRRDSALRARLLGDGEILLLSVGRISHEKRLGVLLDAYLAAKADFPGLRLAIAGDGPAREELAANAPDGVTFVGEVFADELAELYASADVFCFPSTTDTFGQVVLEAGASGLPVIAAAAGGALDLVKHSWTGLHVPPEDAEAFAEAILRCAVSDGLRLSLGAGGRAFAVERGWDKALDQLRRAYRSATAVDVPEVREVLAA